MNTYFSNLSLSIDKGELLTLVSAQHAHKTVLIQTIIHELIPTRGFVNLNGVEMSGVCG